MAKSLAERFWPNSKSFFFFPLSASLLIYWSPFNFKKSAVFMWVVVWTLFLCCCSTQLEVYVAELCKVDLWNKMILKKLSWACRVKWLILRGEVLDCRSPCKWSQSVSVCWNRSYIYRTLFVGKYLSFFNKFVLVDFFTAGTNSPKIESRPRLKKS